MAHPLKEGSSAQALDTCAQMQECWMLPSKMADGPFRHLHTPHLHTHTDKRGALLWMPDLHLKTMTTGRRSVGGTMWLGISTTAPGACRCLPMAGQRLKVALRKAPPHTHKETVLVILYSTGNSVHLTCLLLLFFLPKQSTETVTETGLRIT